MCIGENGFSKQTVFTKRNGVSGDFSRRNVTGKEGDAFRGLVRKLLGMSASNIIVPG